MHQTIKVRPNTQLILDFNIESKSGVQNQL